MNREIARGVIVLIAMTAAILAMTAISYADSSKSSTFSSGMEGWRAGNDVTLSWQSSGGNPDGYLKGVDKQEGTWWYFVSPLDWAGDWRSYDLLSYDLIRITGSAYDPNVREILIIGNNGTTLSCDQPIPTTTWKTYTLALNPSTFGVNQTVYDNVMMNVKELWIRGEFSTVQDSAGLDNVILARQTPPVPEIPIIFLIGLGLAGVVGLMVFRCHRGNHTAA